MIFMSFDSTIVFIFNPIALRKAKMYTILAFLSATGFIAKKKIL